MEPKLEVTMDEYLPLRDVVFKTLRQAILRGELKPGERLMEIKLANKLGVSRTPIREAIRKLELEGLVLMIPRRGAEVAEITEKSLNDVLEVRKALEELAVQLACERMDEEGLEALKKAAKEFEESLGSEDVTRIAEADVAYHDIICRSTDNQRLMQLLNNFREQMYRYRVEYLKKKECYPQLLREHQAIIEAIEAGRQIEKVYLKKGADGVLLGELAELCRQRRIRVQWVPVEKLNRLAQGNHQGAVALTASIEYVGLHELLESIPGDETPLLVVLDGVTDVRNFGAIARSAECAGVHGLIMPVKNSAPVNAESMKSSAGALSVIPVSRVGSVRNTLKILQSEGLQIVAATEKSNTLLFEADLTKPTALVMGSEDVGISKEVLKMCDLQLAIPIVGSIESLNVSAAAAVMLFETARQRINNR